MRLLKPSRPAEAESAETVPELNEPDELELLEIEDDIVESAEEVDDERPASFDGPRTWEEVEETEAQRLSLNISTHAVPSNDSGEAAARLAWQVAVLESDSQDPLGLGRIDAHGLRLVSVSCIYTFARFHIANEACVLQDAAQNKC